MSVQRRYGGAEFERAAVEGPGGPLNLRSWAVELSGTEQRTPPPLLGKAVHRNGTRTLGLTTGDLEATGSLSVRQCWRATLAARVVDKILRSNWHTVATEVPVESWWIKIYLHEDYLCNLILYNLVLYLMLILWFQ